MGIPQRDDEVGGAVLALVAHDEKKDDLLRLATRYRYALANLRLIATGHTGTRLAEELDLEVERVHSGPMGGDLEIGARIVAGDVDAVVFLRDPLAAHPHEPDIQALLKVCDVHGGAGGDEPRVGRDPAAVALPGHVVGPRRRRRRRPVTTLPNASRPAVSDPLTGCTADRSR